MIDLSEQDLVNCASSHGCNGDIPPTAFDFAMNKGQKRNFQTPYIARV
jgi:hypothetical protein